MLAIFGGSGFENFEGFEVLEYLNEKTPFGSTSSGFKKVKINGVKCLFMSRHGTHHEKLPSEVNYRANIYALKREGATSLVSFSAVGSLQKQFKPGDLVIPKQYIDRTKGIRKSTFLGEGMVGHVSLAKPTSETISEKIFEMLKEETNTSFDIFHGQTYVCIEGPFFSTQAESHWYRSMGGDIIGMTHFPEYALAREAELDYIPCCFVTDYDCWGDSRPHVTVEEVIDIMRKNNKKGFDILTKIVANQTKLFTTSDAKGHGLGTGLMSAKEKLNEEQKHILKVLL
jgi:5'-methylthioadenosine phosphorylase